MDTVPSLGLLFDILMLSCVTEILRLWVCRSSPFTCSCGLWIRWILGWANSYPRIWAWVVTVLVSPPALPHHHHQGELSSTVLASSPNEAGCKEQNQFSCSPAPGPADLHSPLQGQLSHFPRQGTGPFLLIAVGGIGMGVGQLSCSPALRAILPTFQPIMRVSSAVLHR